MDIFITDLDEYGTGIGEEIASDREATARVEYVYQDRNEVQIVHLEKIGVEWKIARVESA